MALPAANLKEIRQRRQLTLREAAAEIGIAFSVLHRAEQGSEVSLRNGVKIAQHYGLAVADLVQDDEAAA